MARLLFIRWLVLQGKLSDQIEDAHFSAQIEFSQQSLPGKKRVKEQVCFSTHSSAQRALWLRHTLRALRAVFARWVA
jgi:hypothetical protein